MRCLLAKRLRVLLLVAVVSGLMAMAAPADSSRSRAGAGVTPTTDAARSVIVPGDTTPIAAGEFLIDYAIAYGPVPSLVVSVGSAPRGYEVRLVRLDLSPGTTQALTGSTNWAIDVVSGAVTLSTDDGPGGQLIESGSSEGGGSSGGPQRQPGEEQTDAPPRTWTLSHVAGGPAVIWLTALVPRDTPLPSPVTGGTLAQVGSLPIPLLAPGTLLEIGLRAEGGSPIPFALDGPGGSGRTTPLPGTVPSALVLAKDAGITISSSDGTSVVLAADESQVFEDATGLAVTAPLEDVADTPLQYVAITARAVTQEPPVLDGAMPAATPVVVAIPPDAIDYSGGPVACDAAPRSADEIANLPNILLATPTLYTDPFGRSAQGQAGTGVPVDPTELAGVSGTLAELSVCGQLSDVPRSLALYTDPFAALFVATVPSQLLEATPTATSDPTAPREPVPFSLWQVERFPDGRVGAYVATDGAVSYATFVAGPDGQWLIDVVEGVAAADQSLAQG